MRNKKTYILSAMAFFAIAAALAVSINGYGSVPSVSESEESGFEEPEENAPDFPYEAKLRELAGWKRPEGPFKVALQAGHWKSAEAPEELVKLRTNTGTSGGGKAEWEVNLKIAQETKRLLEEENPGVIAEILPATVPPGYWADVFVAIHADGNESPSVEGFKAAAPRRDLTGKAESLVSLLDAFYREKTGFRQDPGVTRNMRGYYAFNWRRYQHSLHPMTVAVIIETGFLTNASNRRTLISQPARPAG